LNPAFPSGKVDVRDWLINMSAATRQGSLMSSGETFPQLLARARNGDDEAAAVIFQRFVDRLAAHADRYLSPAVRRRTDPEDVVQSVYRTFFRRVRQGEFQVDHWGSLWGLLTRIAVRKCAHAGRGKNRTREVLLSPGSDTLEWAEGWEALAREPSPAEEAALSDLLETLLDPLRESHREIVRLTLQGHTQEEVGERLGCSERTVRRVLAQLEADLERFDLP
jgi:RNA polymerase sigma-70 factor, ECF subfamily